MVYECKIASEGINFMRGFLTIWVIASCFFLPKAWCRYYDLYRADYVKGAFCSVIGGACAADTDFDNSFFQNPASLTAGGSNWDYDYDMLQGSNLEPGMKAGNDVSDSTFMFGAAYSGKKLGVGLSFLKHNTSVGALGTFSDDAAGGSAQFRTNTEADLYQFNVPISIKLSPKYDFGVTLTAIYQKIDIKVSGQNGTAANTAQQPGPTLGIATGGIYRINSSFITGGWLRLPMTYYTKQNITTQSTFTKFNYTEDLALHPGNRR